MIAFVCLACVRSRVHDDRHSVRVEGRSLLGGHEQRGGAATVPRAGPPPALHRRRADHRYIEPCSDFATD